MADAEKQIAMPTRPLVEILSRFNKASTWSSIRTYGTLPSLLGILIGQSTALEVQLLSRGSDGTWSGDALGFDRTESVS